MWSKFPEHTPKESGYYFVEYFNPEQNGIFYKAIWYDSSKEEWCPWRSGVNGLIVYRYIVESRNSYYCPCQIWAEERWDEIWESR